GRAEHGAHRGPDRGAHAAKRRDRDHQPRPPGFAGRGAGRGHRTSSKRGQPVSERWVVLDVGETLVDETRVWSSWADELRIPRLTFMAGLGAVIARGGNHPEVFAMFGSRDWEESRPALEAA